MTVDPIVLTPTDRGFRVEANVHSEGGPNGLLWFEIEGARVPPKEMLGSAFLAACLSTAAWREEDLQLFDPCDEELMRRIPALARAYSRLHARRRPVHVSAQSARTEPLPDRVAGTSFSGGVDSFYTLLLHTSSETLTPVGAAVTGLGFDTHVGDDAAHRDLIERLTPISEELSLRHLVVGTNFKQFFRPYADWNRVTHGSCLIAYAFLLSGELHTYLVPASAPIDRLYRWGTHALLDNAWRSRHLRIETDGWDIHRNDKLRVIADSSLAMRHLRVCARGRGVHNCGKCEKCLRTMTLLELYDRADRCTAFPHRLDERRLRSLRLKTERETYWYRKMLEMARQKPQHAWIARGLRFALGRYRFHSPRYWLTERLSGGHVRGNEPTRR